MFINALLCYFFLFFLLSLESGVWKEDSEALKALAEQDPNTETLSHTSASEDDDSDVDSTTGVRRRKRSLSLGRTQNLGEESVVNPECSENGQGHAGEEKKGDSEGDRDSKDRCKEKPKGPVQKSWQEWSAESSIPRNIVFSALAGAGAVAVWIFVRNLLGLLQFLA